MRTFGAHRLTIAGVAALAALFAAPRRAEPAARFDDPRPEERGLPPLRTFGAREMSTSQLFAATAARDRLVAGTLSGVAFFDGAHWQTVTSRRAIYAVAVNDASRVVVGGPDLLGEVRPGPDGRLDLFPLNDVLVPAERAIGDVRSIHAFGDTFIVVTDRRLLRLTKTSLDVKETWEPDPKRRGFSLPGRVVIASSDGLSVRSAAGVSIDDPLAGRDSRRRAASVVADLGDSQTLVGVEGEGAFVVRGAEAWRDVSVGRSGLAALRRGLTDARRLRHGGVAIASEAQGLILLRPDLSLDRIVSRADGLPTDHLLGLTEDAEGGLWAAGETDLTRLDFGSPMTLIDARSGLDGTVVGFARMDGRLHVLSTSGLFQMERGTPLKLTRVPGLPPRVWDVAQTPGAARGDAQGDTIVATATGVYSIGRGAPRLTPGTGSISSYVIEPVAGDPNRLYVGSRSGLSILVRGPMGYTLERHVSGAPRYVRSIVSRPGGLVFVGTPFDGVVWMETRMEAGANGARGQILEDEVHVREMDGQIAALSADPPGLYTIDERARTATPLPQPSGLVDAQPVRFLRDARGSLWISGSGVRVLERGASSPRTVIGNETFVQGLFAESDGVVWMGEDSRVWRSVEGQDGRSAERRPSVGRVFVNGSEVAKESASSLAFGFERLRVELSPGTYSKDTATDFRLEPLDATWSVERRGAVAEYSSLAEGRYRLHLRPAGREEATPVVWEFEVRPPWRRSTAARATQAGLLLALVGGAVQWRTRRLRRLRRDLEDAVEEKTRALSDANARLDALARHDELTGLFNRRHFEERLELEWARATRERGSLALAMVDIDHFKALNDSLGHPEGDRALKRVAGVIEARARRPGDVAARYGGEEFAILLPSVTRDGSWSLCEEIRAAVEGLGIANPGAGEFALTVSIGVAIRSFGNALVTASTGAATSSDVRHVSEPESLVADADAALYRAKQAGRNRTSE